MSEQNAFKMLSPHIGYLAGATNVGVICSYDEQMQQNALYLIDSAGNRTDAESVYRALCTQFPNMPLKAIINTHAHADHCGGNVWLKEHTGCQVWATKGEAVMMEIPALQSSLVYGAAPIQEIASPYLMAEACAVDAILRPDEPISAGKGITLTPVALPGHYIDMAAMVVADTSAAKSTTVAFLADGISGRNVIRRYWIQYLYDEGLFKRSLEKIRTISADYYIPGHGDLVTEIEGLVELNQIALLETEAMILDELTKPMTFEELLKAVADRNQITLRISQYELIGSTLRAYIASLHNAGKIDYVITGNTLRWKRIQDAE